MSTMVSGDRFARTLRSVRKRLRVRQRAQRLLGGRAWDLLWPGSERVPVYVPPGHYYSPIPSTRDITELTTYPVVAIELRIAQQIEFLSQLEISAPIGPRFAENPMFESGDASIYQSMLRHFRPQRVVEVGAGWSSAALFDAGAAPEVTLIDPYPDRVYQVLTSRDLERCRVLAARLQDVPIECFAALRAGDVLFIDSTHVSRLGSDVNRLFFEVLPALASGVILHFHDVLYPFEYPEQWARVGRAWNEVYMLRAFLEYNREFEILLWPDMLQRLGEVPAGAVPGLAGQESGGIWIRKA